MKSDRIYDLNDEIDEIWEDINAQPCKKQPNKKFCELASVCSDWDDLYYLWEKEIDFSVIEELEDKLMQKYYEIKELLDLLHIEEK